MTGGNNRELGRDVDALIDRLIVELRPRLRTALIEAARLGASYRMRTGAHPPEYDWTVDDDTDPIPPRPKR